MDLVFYPFGPSVFEFSDFFFLLFVHVWDWCYLLDFYFMHCIFQLQNFCLVLFDDFYLYWTSHFVPMLFSWFCWVIYQYSNSLTFLKTIVLNSLAGSLYISISLGLVTRKALYSFVGVYFPSFLFSLKTCMAMFACEEVFTPSSLYWLTSGKKYLHQSAQLEILRLSHTLSVDAPDLHLYVTHVKHSLTACFC